MNSSLLSRENFRNLVLKRNNGYCVVASCSEKAVDAHHILNRRLYIEKDEEGGYFLANGAGLCSRHHLAAENTQISTKDLYIWCEIENPKIPRSFDSSLEYDTWGNIIYEDGSRLQGPLFADDGCQKALKNGNALWKFWH